MAAILVDLADNTRDCTINWWNWRPIVEIIRASGLLADEKVDSLHYTFSELTEAQAREVGEYIESEVLPRLKEDERIHYDGRISKTPTELLRVTETDADELYGAQWDALKGFAEFCKLCGGFIIY